jgi:hypothetical protein
MRTPFLQLPMGRFEISKNEKGVIHVALYLITQ